MSLPPGARMEAALEELENLHDLLEKIGTEADVIRNAFDSAYNRAILKAHAKNAEGRKAEAYLACEDLAQEVRILEGKLDRIKAKVKSNHEVLATLRSINANLRNVA